MPLRTTLQTILTEYHTATAEPLEGHKLANFIRHSAASEVDGALGELGAGLMLREAPAPAIGLPSHGFLFLIPRSRPAPLAVTTLSTYSTLASLLCISRSIRVRQMCVMSSAVAPGKC
jgi:hypothetical protein